MGRVMGVDYGTRRIGVALSDALQIAAHPHTVLDATADDLMLQIASIVDTQDVVEIVVGLPTGLDGSEGESARGARRLAERLADAVTVRVSLADERYTSTIAERALIEGNVRRAERKSTVDKVAAAVMLQSFLDRPAPNTAVPDGHHPTDTKPI